MRLKRGAEREACDFCHRRKIKCDRLSRVNQGHVSCSPCSLRLVDCCLDDSNDVRLRRRRQANAPGIGVADAGIRVEQQSITPQHRQSAPYQPNNGRRPTVNTNPDDRFSGSGFHIFPETPLETPPACSLGDAPPQDSVATVHPSAVRETGPWSFDEQFGLSLDSLLFLDQMFVGNYGYKETGSCLTPTTPGLSDSFATEKDYTGHTPSGDSLEASVDENSPQQVWVSCDVDPGTVMEAITAYFKFAALCLPVIFEGAFWEDYGARRCSPALVYAIACRGMPFTATDNKWDVQQHLAGCFREAFLAAQREPTEEARLRLDVLEALAIMVGFEYDAAKSSSVHPSVEDLLIRHDTLVLLTLQLGLQDNKVLEPRSSTRLSQFRERRALLFWHVYGIDAFYALDHKTMSRIMDNDIDFNENLPRHAAWGYLDTILALAFIARCIFKRLCGATARRRGIDLVDLTNLYDQLDYWRNNLCPVHLRRAGDEALLPDSAVNAPGSPVGQIHLHRSVIWLLEINCYLQIESCVDDYGLQNNTSIEAEMALFRVEHETLRATRDAFKVCRWNTLLQTQDRRVSNQHSMFNLEPGILRNIPAGVCFWTCTRGIRLARSRSAVTMPRPLDAGDRKSLAERLRNYKDVADTLRNAVASAASHCDTDRVLERLDKQLGLLGDELRNL